MSTTTFVVSISSLLVCLSILYIALMIISDVRIKSSEKKGHDILMDTLFQENKNFTIICDGILLSIIIVIIFAVSYALTLL